MNDEARWNVGDLMEMSSAYWRSCTLFAAVRVGLTQCMARKQEAATAEELAQELECSLRGITALLDALTAIELVIKQDGAYRLHPDAQPLLTPGHFLDRTHILLHMADIVSRWDRLAEAVREGHPSGWTMDQADMPPEHAEHYYRGMSDVARIQTKGLATRLGLRADQNLLDVGGGHGLYAYACADEMPGLKATVFDLPSSRPFFDEEGSRHAQAAHVDFRAGDIRRPPLDLGGPYDVAWISQVLHIEGPEVCTRLLAEAAGALKPGGALWIQEFILEDDRAAPEWPALFNLNMLLHDREGKSYSKSELCGMMESAGLTDITFEGPTQPNSPAALMRGVKP